MSLAGQSNGSKSTAGLVQMTDNQMDKVTAGALVNVFDVASGNKVAIPVNAEVAANVNALSQQFGNPISQSGQPGLIIRQ